MWHAIRSEIVYNKFSLSLAVLAVALLLGVHSMWGNGFGGAQARTVVYLICVTAVLLTLHVNGIYPGVNKAASQRDALARLGVIMLFWVGALGVFCAVGHAAGFMSSDAMWGLLSSTGLLAGLNAVFVIGSHASVHAGERADVDRMIGVFFEVLLVGAALFWAVLSSGYFESASPVRSFLLYVFFTPLGAIAHLFLGAVLCAVSFLLVAVRRSLETVS